MGKCQTDLAFFFPVEKKKSLVITDKRDVSSLGSYSTVIYTLSLVSATYIRVINWDLWEQRFVVHQPQWVIVCTRSGMAEGKTPAGMNSSAAVFAGMLSKTDNVTFQ